MVASLALLRQRTEAPPPPPGSSERVNLGDELETGASGWYVCAACVARLAREDWVLEPSSEGPLVFANPHGRFFELLLVSRVVGAIFDRHATTEFTWFAGYAWCVGACACCGAHIGWRFEATQNEVSLREFVALSRAAVQLVRFE